MGASAERINYTDDSQTGIPSFYQLCAACTANHQQVLHQKAQDGILPVVPVSMPPGATKLTHADVKEQLQRMKMNAQAVSAEADPDRTVEPNLPTMAQCKSCSTPIEREPCPHRPRQFKELCFDCHARDKAIRERANTATVSTPRPKVGQVQASETLDFDSFVFE